MRDSECVSERALHATSSSHFSRLRCTVCTSWRISGRENGALDRFRWPWRFSVARFCTEKAKQARLSFIVRDAQSVVIGVEHGSLARSSSFVSRNAANTDSRAVVQLARTRASSATSGPLRLDRGKVARAGATYLSKKIYSSWVY